MKVIINYACITNICFILQNNMYYILNLFTIKNDLNSKTLNFVEAVPFDYHIIPMVISPLNFGTPAIKACYL